jgi:hypothetical protein
VCTGCGVVHDWDDNAAGNLLAKMNALMRAQSLSRRGGSLLMKTKGDWFGGPGALS